MNGGNDDADEMSDSGSSISLELNEEATTQPNGILITLEPSAFDENVSIGNKTQCGVTDKDKNGGIGFLASANFSTDSIANFSTDSIADATILDNNNNNNNNLQTINVQTPKRFSNSLSNLSSSPQLAPSSQYSSHSGRSRPLSAFLMDSANFIKEDGLENNEADTTASYARNSFSGTGTRLDYSQSQQQYAMMNPEQSSGQNHRSPSSPTRSTSPVRITRQYRAKSPVRRSSSPRKSKPFNFQPQELSINSNSSNQSLHVKPAHRKGHKYKHSSISMNLFQEPSPASITDTQLKAIPDSYPIPNYKEAFSSITKNQKLRLLWVSIHFVSSIIVFITGYKLGQSSLSTLAHLIFYDSLGSLFIVLVDVMANFEVWGNSSIAYPFGLERLEVLVGFGLSASLVMLGFDLLSHFMEEFVLSWVSHDNHTEHEHLSHHVHEEDSGSITNVFAYETVLLFTLVVSLISSNLILAYDRINELLNSPEKKPYSNGMTQNVLLEQQQQKQQQQQQKEMKEWRIFKVISAWRNYPTHLVTITYTLFLVIIPLVPETLIKDLAYDMNKCATFLVASLLCYNGWSLVKSLGEILLCAFPYSDYQYSIIKSRIIEQILELDYFRKEYHIKKLVVTKFNYNLYVIGVSIEMKGADTDEEARMRFAVNKVIRNEIKGLENGLRELNLETTITIDRF
ncbi:ZRG17 [Candida oxycetoniae]|uniref:ZRG17 n=1 Tax=Candida oxycetoniae TaxID=497107 RepID=A0AAI9SYU1_9ASCO|nr:ZRG17 [Candida oxycetoniae]KAI3405502.2 ZRG17 [Candida oxycetoniae]